MKSNPSSVFEATREYVKTLINTRPPIAEYPKDEREGVYLLFVNGFEDEKTLPIYVGKGTGKGGAQKRYLDHLHHLIALNRYSGEDYRHVLIETELLDGYLLYPKMLKFLVDRHLTLSDISCVLLEECDSSSALQREKHWIDCLHAANFGFNQVNSKTIMQAPDSSDCEFAEQRSMLVLEDLKSCREFWGYGYTDFNFRYVLTIGGILPPLFNGSEKARDLAREIQAADIAGKPVYDEFQRRMIRLLDLNRDKLNFPKEMPLEVKILNFLRSLSLAGQVPATYFLMLREWRKFLLPTTLKYDYCPMGDRFAPFNFPEPSSKRKTCQIRVELSSPSPRMLRRSKLRQQPQIMRVDYRFVDQCGNAISGEGGSFIDCDVTRHLADPNIVYKLKAELLKVPIRTHGWYTWMTLRDGDKKDATQYLWQYSPALADGLWNDNGPNYSNEYEQTVGINKSTLKDQELLPLAEVLEPVFKKAKNERYRIEAFSNVGAKVLKRAIRMQLANGNVFIHDSDMYMLEVDLDAHLIRNTRMPRIGHAAMYEDPHLR